MKATHFKFLLVATGILTCGEVASDPFDDSFFPYRDGVPSHPGLEVGMTITQDNVAQFQEILDPATYESITKGWYDIEIGATKSFALHPAYVEASRANVDNITLVDPGVVSRNYNAGRAFPHPPVANDPQAGLKLIWNYQYGFNAGDSETIDPFWWTFRDGKTGKVERVIKFEWHFLNWMHRVQFDPKPSLPNNPSGIFRSGYSIVKDPFDLKDTQLLIHRYKDDLKRDDAWLYLGFQRRVRRLATGQRTDAFLGTDIMIEDFEGYNGRVSDYSWSYVGSKSVLAPFHFHDQTDLEPEAPGTPDGFKFVKFGGHGGCYPQVAWQLRTMDIVEGTPKDSAHPLSKRTIYIDRETAVMPMLIVYDRAGALWKSFIICKAHADHHHPRNKGAGVPIETCAVLHDRQADHCTTLQFRSIINAEENPASLFSVQNLRKSGR